MRRLLSCVALLCAVSAAAAAASAPRPDSFQAYLFSAGAAGSAAKTADYDGGYGYEYDKKGYTQHESIALVEARQTQCRYTGSGADVWTSEIACRRSHYDQYDHAPTFDTTLASSGACRWTIEYYYVDDDTGCGWIPIENGKQTYAVGSATARCTFARGDACGEPLCDKMVVTVSGELYATKAYTKSSTSTPSSIYGGDCANVDGWEGYFSDCDSTYPLDGITNGGGKRKTGNSATGKAAGGRRRGRANNAQKQPAAASVGVASANYDERYYEEDHNVYYNATALIIVGSVTSINGQKYNKEGGYTDGTVQYVPFVYVAPGTTATSNKPYDYPVVTAQSVRMAFVKDGVEYKYSN